MLFNSSLKPVKHFYGLMLSFSRRPVTRNESFKPKNSKFDFTEHSQQHQSTNQHPWNIDFHGYCTITLTLRYYSACIDFTETVAAVKFGKNSLQVFEFHLYANNMK